MRRALQALRPLGVACMAAGLSVGVGLVGGGVARANGPTETGWWNQLDPAALAGTPLGGAVAPPDVPPGGLYVANGPGGPMAIAALRIDVPARGTSTLSLKAAAAQGFAPPVAIDACLATSPWQSAANGAWESRPSYSSTAPPCVHGLAETSGSLMRWVLTSALQPNGGHTYDVVLVPVGAIPFRVPMASPGPDTVTNFPTVPPPAAAPGPVVAPAPAASTSLPSGEGGLATSGDTGPPVLSSQVPSSAAAVGSASSFAAPARPPAPGVAAASGTAGEQALSLEPALGPVRPPDKRTQRILAVALLVALGSALLWFGGRPARPPRLLGSLGGGTGGRPLAAAPVYGREVVGGVGRFSRVRAAPPARL